MNALSNSAVNCARDCKRKYYYKYDLGIKRRGEFSQALHFGKLWHTVMAWWFGPYNTSGAAVEAFLASQDATEDDIRRCRAMLMGYAKWPMDRMMTLSEQELRAAILNPATGRSSQRFEQFGFLDMLALHNDGKIWLWEHKTAASVDGGYLEKLWSDSQITGYYAVLRDMGINVEGVIYDIAVKPKLEVGSSRPTRQLNTGDRLVYVTEQKTQWAEYGGKGRWKKKDFPCVEFISQEDADAAALKQFYERLEEWHLTTEDAYHRETVYISDRQVADWREDVWQVTQELLACRRTNYWYRNTARCYDWHRPCEYAALCQNGASEALVNSEYEIRVTPSNNDIQQAEKPVF